MVFKLRLFFLLYKDLTYLMNFLLILDMLLKHIFLGLLDIKLALFLLIGISSLLLHHAVHSVIIVLEFVF